MTAPPVIDRRARRRQTTKEEILEAAWTLARTQGLTEFSLRDLAASIGMRAPSLYEYFASKNAIYDAMFGQGMREALAAATAKSKSRTLRGALRENAHRMFDFATVDPARTQLLFLRTLPGFEPSPESYAPAVELSARVQRLLVEHGITHPDAMDLWTALISGLINQQLANDPGGQRWGRLIDLAVDMFIAAISPNRPARSRAKEAHDDADTGRRDR
ncbi:MAG TPA: TetR/AcrR family transcriptional regulator [Acidimicrobiales bacterium]|nr:TetR/AcrR family transcriptional regulator [Acidimicrobiales bacterium]